MEKLQSQRRFNLKPRRKNQMQKCRGCGAEIIFVQSKNGKHIPCDPKLRTIVTEEGNVVKGYESHFATCPMANSFRKEYT